MCEGFWTRDSAHAESVMATPVPTSHPFSSMVARQPSSKRIDSSTQAR